MILMTDINRFDLFRKRVVFILTTLTLEQNLIVVFVEEFKSVETIICDISKM